MHDQERINEHKRLQCLDDLQRLHDWHLQHSAEVKVWWEEQWRRNERIYNKIEEQNERLRLLETFQATVTVKIGVATFIGAILGGAVVSFVFHSIVGG